MNRAYKIIFYGEGTHWYFNVARMYVESDSFSSPLTAIVIVTAAGVAVDSSSLMIILWTFINCYHWLSEAACHI